MVNTKSFRSVILKKNGRIAMNKEEVKDFIIQYIRDGIGIELPPEIKDSQNSLLDPEGGIQSRDLLVLVMNLQEKYNVTFREDVILENRLDYIDNIVLCVIGK